jgi:hypothetical protein
MAVCVMFGCADQDTAVNGDYLIRLKDIVVTVAEFNRAFEIAKAAYSHSEMQDPVAVRNAKLRLLNQMTEEMIIEERAKERGITVSDAELEKAIAEIKKDYPDDVFEQMLLEYAVSYDDWKKRVKNRLLMEKVVADELEAKTTVTADDIAKYYQENGNDSESAADEEEDSPGVNTDIVKYLRMKKAEGLYQPWIKKLHDAYTIEVNGLAWEKILGKQKMVP